jgi:hypothetical protein
VLVFWLLTPAHLAAHGQAADHHCDFWQTLAP